MSHVIWGNYTKAISALEPLYDQEPADFLVCFLLGSSHFELGQYGPSELYFTQCIARWPEAYVAYFRRGTCRLRRGDFEGAERDLTRALQQRPELVEALFNRAIARRRQQNLEGAIDDYTAIIDLGRTDPLPVLLRADTYIQLGDLEHAERDRQTGIHATPIDVDGWNQRSLARLPDDPSGAVDDLDQALTLDPRSRRALKNRAIILAEHFGNSEEALVSVNRMLEMDPHDTDALFMRGTLRARLQQRNAAVEDAHAALKLNASALACYQAACILAETSRGTPDDGAVAVRLLGMSLQRDLNLVDQMRDDPDLQPIANRGSA